MASDLDKLRHSAAHVMADAVKRLWPEAKLTIGPPIETGFYYDFDIDRPFTEDDLGKIEEAKKRDHRKLGKELDLFSIDETIGGGLVLWHPKGARVRYLAEQFWREEHFAQGYDLVGSPHIARDELWKTSGHLSFYKENM